MFLQRIKILNYKNYRQASVSFSEKFTLITGDNGSGKTNLIDAIYYLCICKSYFTRQDNSIVHYAEHVFRTDGNFLLGNEEILITCKYQNTKKEFYKNAVLYDRLSDHVGLIPVVMIAPNDIDIIHDGSEARRRFLDAAISQINHDYLKRLMQYNKLLQQRNTLLKNYGLSKTIDYTLLDVLDMQMAAEGDFIFDVRKTYIQQFEKICYGLYNLISAEKEKASIEYISQVALQNSRDLLKNNLKNDLEAERTTTGIHKDDIGLLLNGAAIRENGSQGQIKSFLIALKLAQYKMVAEITEKYSILLLDDIFEKLDKKRLSVLFNMLNSEKYMQIFLTDSDEERSKHFLSENGITYNHVTIINGKIG